VLNSVSCPTTKSCDAVGFADTASGASETLVESFNGSAWSIVSSPDSGTLSNSLNSVWCGSSSSCVAVGSYATSAGGEATLVESFNGSVWSIVSSPSPGGSNADDSLNGLSCTSSTVCTAVGYRSSTSDAERSTLVEDWNGTSWSTVSTPDPGSTANVLNAVSCVTGSTFCAAVGYSSSGAGNQTLVLLNNGTGWTVSTSPDPGSSANYLGGVSCADTSFCAAVGYYSNGSVEKTLAETYTGTQWTVAPSENEGSDDNSMGAVNCPKPRVSFSVGNFNDITPPTSGKAESADAVQVNQTLTESYNGSSWVITASPDKGNGDNALAGVSCVSPSFCVAVGLYHQSAGPGPGEPLILMWNGEFWAIASSPNLSSKASFASVSCSSPAFCVAVGEKSATFVETWNGTQWSTTPSPNVGSGDELSGISCVSSNFCAAVGTWKGPHTTTGALVESWNGSTWSLSSNPSPTQNADLSAVSCVSATSCMADGSYQGGTLIEAWNGSHWSVSPSPNPQGYLHDSVLYGVACVSKTSCFAVGRNFYQNSNYAYITLIEAWNGKVWSIVSSPNPGLLDVLTGVACASSKECAAVGYHYSNTLGPGYLQTMILSWNGTSWSTTNSPNLGNKYKRNSNDLQGVTCPSSTYCVAVGGYSPQNNGGDKPSGVEENLIETGT
jgi:hypothetical protein